MELHESIERTWRPTGKNFWFSQRSVDNDPQNKMNGMITFRWTNCLYLHFFKEDYSQYTTPKIVDGYGGRKRFDYSESSLNSLNFHGGITYYTEMYFPETGMTQVKVGCDYSHYMDDEYARRDCGKEILKFDAPGLVAEFTDLMNELLENKEGKPA